MGLEKIPFNLGEMIESVGDQFADSAQKKGLELVCEIQAECFNTIVGDPIRLRQVLTNLCGNAIKFTENGDIIISVELVKFDFDRVEFCFSVSDTGIGIPEEATQHIFHSFSQADGSTTRRYGGTGLGLAICKELALLMDGDIGVSSAYGEGSKFYFTAVFDHELEDLGNNSLQIQELQEVRTLLISRHPVLIKELLRIFDIWGIAIQVVNGLEKMEHLLSHGHANDFPYDIVLVDNVYKNKAIKSLVNHITEVQADTNVKVGLLHTVVSESDHVLYEKGIVDFVLSKPIKRNLLMDAFTMTREEWMASQSPLAQTGLQDDLLSTSILVAEDNPVNQELTLEMLKSMGCFVTVVDNGNNAIKALAKRDYDIVLMDCQMPEKDGYQATREIRAIEKEHPGQRHAIIIALTANARKEDRDICLSVGMDDYLSKPFTGVQLKEMIQKWHASGDSAADTPSDYSDENQSEEIVQNSRALEHIDTAAIDSIRSLDKSGSNNLLKKLIDMYLENAPVLINEIGIAIEMKSYTNLRMAAHSLKSSSGNIGAINVFEICKMLEDMGRNEDITKAKEHFEILESAIPKIGEALRSQLAA